MKPMSECRVLDLGIITAGAATSAILADLGAEVIKIESAAHKDPFRTWGEEALPGEHPDLPLFFRMTNRGKLNAGIHLKSPEGRDAFLRLVAKSDIVVENFSRGVLARLGLDYQALKAVNPEIILASISSQGEDGPDAGFTSFGTTLEAMAGLTDITGYLDGPPVVSGNELNYPDQVASIFAAAMIVTAWYAKEQGEGGAHLDLSQRELTSFLAGEAFVSSSGRLGNGQPGIFLQDCYLTRDGRWLAVTINEPQLDWLRGATGGDTGKGLAKWMGERDSADALAALLDAGVIASRVRDGSDALQEENVGWSHAITRGPNGDVLKGAVFQDTNTPASLERPAALVGADTRDVLARIAGFSEAEISSMILSGAIFSTD